MCLPGAKTQTKARRTAKADIYQYTAEAYRRK